MTRVLKHPHGSRMRARASACVRALVRGSVAMLALAAAGCAVDDTSDDVLIVHAAASLTDVMDVIAADFEANNPGVDVQINVGGSSALASQIVEGAPGDVFASADLAQMGVVHDAGLAPHPLAFATNTLTIAVAPGNPRGFAGLADLTDPSLDVVVCAAPVPCGEVALAVEKAAGVDIQPVSEELSVTEVLAKVTSGQADPGLVYVTDIARSKGEAEEVPLGGDESVAIAAGTQYPIASLTTATDPIVADAFVGFVLSDSGQSALENAGFGSP
ncbi:molybdate ABC transporter substrate-binding protein [Demequina sp. NBRC 110051]|uniref:molybdate ABC transporter substrate-binding protein n=1 Tax=Demequina sp. NBRC 110051 TaxID=1570340 RepID=UPI001F2CC929|nr:molybdate ABC transporter substrate-binding protein [Demequina sp. NBRC 110051]